MGLRGFLDNARREASSMAQGLFPAAQAIGQQTVNDLDRAIFTKGMGAPPRSTSFGLDNLGKMAAKGWYNDSPIVPLLSLDLNEAGSRFYDRPISGTFDFIGAGSVAGQGLRLGSKIPGSLGESALRARGYQKADISSLGMGTTVGEMPTRFKMADGSDALGREYLMRMQDQTHDGNLWLRKTMRSAKPSADTVFNEAVDTAETLADDPLTLQAIPRARYEGFARVGDKLNSITPPKTNNPALDWLSEATFGPQVGSRRFGKRLIIRNQSRLKTSINEMMGLRGVMKKQIEKQYGKDADQIVGDATFLEAAGFRTSGDLGAIEEAFAPSGRKAVLDGDRVDLQSGSLDAIQKRMDELQSEYDALPYRDEHKAQRVARGQDKWTDEERRNMDRGNEIGDEMVALHKKKKKAKAGNVVELNRAELRLAEAAVRQRDSVLLEELAKDIEEFNNKGYEAVLTGGEAPVVLTPDSVRRGGDALAYALPNRNLHIRRIDHTVEPTKPFDQGKLFDDSPMKKDSPNTGGDEAPETAYSDDQGQLFSSASDGGTNRPPRSIDPNTGRWVDIESDVRAYPRVGPDDFSFTPEETHTINVIAKGMADHGASPDRVDGIRRHLIERRVSEDYFDYAEESVTDPASALERAEENARRIAEHADRAEKMIQAAVAKTHHLLGAVDETTPRKILRQHPGGRSDWPRARASDEDVSAIAQFDESVSRMISGEIEVAIRAAKDLAENGGPAMPIRGDDLNRLVDAATDKIMESSEAARSAGRTAVKVRVRSQIVARMDEVYQANRNIGSTDPKDIGTPQVAAVDSPEPRRGSAEEVESARAEAFPSADGSPFDTPEVDPPEMFGEVDASIVEFQRQLRAKTSENYGQMAWYKNYLDQMVKARVNDGPDITYKFRSLAKNQQVRDMLDDEFFQTEILPKHKTLVAAQLEADKVRLGANALNQDNVVRNTDRLAMLFGKDGQGSFFVARPKYGDPKGTKRIKGDSDIEVLDENLPGDPQELIAKGILDTSPEVHLKNYLVSKNDASKQELADSVADASVSIGSAQQKAYIDEGMAVTEEGFRKGARETPYVIVEPNGDLYKRIEEMQPLANQAARRLKEDGYHDEAANIQQTAREAFEATGDGDFSLGDMIRNPKLRGEIDDTRYMIPREMYEAIRKETDDSTSALSSFLQLSATGFKVSVLHGRWPAWVLNNTIGAQLYLALTGGTGRMIPHAGAGQMVRDYFPDVVGAGSKEVASGADDLGRVAQTNVDKLLATRPGKVGKRVVDTLGDWNQKIADEPARLARLEQVVEERFQSTVRLAKARGIEIPDTLESRRKMLQDQTVREDIAAEVLDDMIDFTTLSRFERKWVSNVIPFWTFIKGSTKSTYRTMSDHPGRVWPVQELGSFGADLTDQEYEGGSPEYLRALLPVANGKALSVGGWNPYSQQSALLSLGAQALSGNMPTGQEHPFSMVNPALTVPMEAINKRDTYTQYPLKGNMLQILGSGAMESIPLFENIKNIAVPQERSGREVFPPSRTNAMLNFAGIPIRNVDEGNMNVRMQTDENRRKKNGTYDYWRFHNGV